MKEGYSPPKISYKENKKIKREACFLCGSKNRLELDHCHKTGKVRAVLCNGCNFMVGFFENGWHDRALGYIESFKNDTSNNLTILAEN